MRRHTTPEDSWPVAAAVALQLLVLYRFVSAVNAVYGLAVAWVYIAAFLAALGMVFIFPPGTLLVFFIGLASLGLAVAMGYVIDALTRWMARRALARSRCPRCGDSLQAPRFNAADDFQTCVCSLCSSNFAGDGSETTARERPHFIEQPRDDGPAAGVHLAHVTGDWRDS